MFNRLFVPLDGSDVARMALHVAETLPSKSVRLLTVLQSEDGFGGLIATAKGEAWLEQRREEGDRYLAAAAAPFEAQGRTTDIRSVFGDPAEEILTHSHDADLIIMTTHGYGMGHRMLYGSVADRIARHSTVPVMLIRGRDGAVDPTPIRRVVVPLDGSELAEMALGMAKRLARELEAPILLVRALDGEKVQEAVQMGSSPAAAYTKSLEVFRHSAAEYLAARAETLRNESLTVAIDIRDGAPASELLNLYEPGDVVVMTSHGRGGVGRWLLGSVSEKLIRLASAPVLLVRSQPPQSS